MPEHFVFTIENTIRFFIGEDDKLFEHYIRQVWLPIWSPFHCEISRTYDEVVDYIIRKLETRPVYGRQVTKVLGVKYTDGHLTGILL